MVGSYDGLDYERFRKMASDESLSRNEKVGFPDSVRDGYEDAIFHDICSKVTNIDDVGKSVLEIGPGCAALPLMTIEKVQDKNHRLVLVDSQEMLDQIPDCRQTIKVAGFFPQCTEAIRAHQNTFDVIVCYSVLHYLFLETSLWDFLDEAIELLAPNGQLLIGDIPNVSKRKRFFASESGAKFHQQYTGTDEVPEVNFTAVEKSKIDDSVILGMIMRARMQGCDGYWLPQSSDLPMANRREDILIVKP